MNGEQRVIDKTEENIECVQVYYFINSSGEISQDFISESSSVNRKKMHNIFKLKDEAKHELQKLLRG